MKRAGGRAKGFTMIEIIAALAIVSILAAVSVPALMGFLESGRQINRDAIARTLYLAAQNRLTEMRVSKTLKAELNNYGFNADSPNPNDSLNSILSIFPIEDAEGNTINIFPIEDAEGNIIEEGTDVYSFSKPLGDNTDNFVTHLLDPLILDKEILNDAILIEFNIKTGVVLSVFYSDTLGDDQSLGYLGNASSADVSGNRPYTDAADRKQGYYGVNQTGELPEDMKITASIYDSSQVPLPDDTNINVLYAMFTIPKSRLSGENFSLVIGNATVHHNIDLGDPLLPLPVSLTDAVAKMSFFDGAAVYQDQSTTDPTVKDIILYWILDYVLGDMRSSASTGIGTMYGDFDPTKNITAGIEASNGAWATSLEAHPYQIVTGPGKYEVASARHLYNIRYNTDAQFTQSRDITLAGVMGFDPIPSLTNAYFGSGKTIRNLTIDASTTNDVGLFSSISGSVSSLTLERFSIKGQNNVGALCGQSSGTLTNIQVANSTIEGQGGVGNVGGVTGQSSGTLANIQVADSTVTGLGNNVGGVTGQSGGTLKSIQASNTSIRGQGNVGGIVGAQSGGSLENIRIGIATVTGLGDNIGGIAGGQSGGSLTNLQASNTSISGQSNVGGVAGGLDGSLTLALVMYDDAAKTIQGTSNVGGIVGRVGDNVSNGSVTDTTFVSSTDAVHISGSATSIGGIAGFCGASGTLSRSQFLALAPEYPVGMIRPIVGDAGAPLDEAKLVYLCGTGVDERPAVIPYNTLSTNGIGTGLDTINIRQITPWSTDWKTLPITGSVDVVVIDPTNDVYPYPYLNGMASALTPLSTFEWPIAAGGGVIDSMAYYEQYADGTYGLWSATNGNGNGSLDSNKKITEAGYVALAKEALTGTHVLYARNGSINSGASWYASEKIGTLTSLASSSSFAQGIIGAATRSGLAADAISYVYELPLAALTAKAGERCQPLKLMHTASGPANPNEISYYLQPMFAKGLYSTATADEYSVRTPWQMRNINTMIGLDDDGAPISGRTNMTTGGATIIQFTQERDLDFTHTGIGVGDAVSASASLSSLTDGVVRGTSSPSSFRGAYDGGDHEISSVTVIGTNSAGLFQSNWGRIENLKLRDITVSGRDNVGALCGQSSGTLLNIEVTDASVTGLGGNVGGVAGQSGGTLTDIQISGSTVTGSGDNVGGISGQSSGVHDDIRANNTTVKGQNNTGGVFGQASGSLTNVRVMTNMTVEGLNNTGGVAGLSSGTVTTVTVSGTTVTGQNSTGGAFGQSSGTVSTVTVSGTTVTGQNSTGGAFGQASGTVTNVQIVNPAVTGRSNVGGSVGDLSGALFQTLVLFDNAARTIQGVANVGGLAGMVSGSGSVADTTFVSSTDAVHIVREPGSAATSIGGIVGLCGDSGTISRSQFLALAPVDSAGTIRPIVGNTLAALNDNTLVYLCGTGVDTRPAVMQYNTQTTNGIGLGVNTVGIHQTVITAWNARNAWSTLVVPALPGLTVVQTVTDPANTVYPYPYLNGTASVLNPLSTFAWPITVSGGVINNIAYFEQYSDNTYGLWNFGSGNGTLSDTKQIAEAGYVVLLDEALIGAHDLYARDGSVTGAWAAGDRIGALTREAVASAFARGILTAAGRDPADTQSAVYKLPLGTLVTRASAQCRPLRLMHANSLSSPSPIDGFLHPMFAKGLYETPTANSYVVRTPWQMRNIDTLAGQPANLTVGATFIQERNLNFADRGIGVSSQNSATASLATINGDGVVARDFWGTYEGNAKSITGLTITSNNTSGLFTTNRGTIQNLTVGITLNGNSNTGVMAGTNFGIIQNSRVEGSTMNTGNGIRGGIAAVNEASASILQCVVTRLGINSNDLMGGIAGQNSGIIERCQVDTLTVSGTSKIGGIAGTNTADATIRQSDATNATITGNGQLGGIAGESYGVIERCTATDVKLDGTNQVGGIAGANMAGASIRRSDTKNSTVKGNGRLGGITGENHHTIELCTVNGVTIEGTNPIGGIAGENLADASVIKSGVQYTTVKGSNTVGGVVGQNAGTVADVYFLSTAEINDIPVTGNGAGGIVGENASATGMVARALYLAPAPYADNSGTRTIYPIVRNGKAAETIIVGSATRETCYYLAGSRYKAASLTTAEWETSWTDEIYNIGIATGDSILCSGGGSWLYTDFLHKDWLEHSYGVSYTGWTQPVGYPYPIVTGQTAPTVWPLTTGPYQPEQVDKLATEWYTVELPGANVLSNLDFSNGDFDLPLREPPRADGGTSAEYTLITGNETSSQSGVNRTRPPWHSGERYWDYIEIDWARGWNTRLVGTPSNYVLDQDNKLEIQRPYATLGTGDPSQGRTTTNYKGTMSGVYAELNAHYQSTLYQISKTEPETTVYYSFYHSTRLQGVTSATDTMTFYLSNMVQRDGKWVYADANGTPLPANSQRPYVIRPCATPRSTATPYGSQTKNTVVYDGTNGGTVQKISFYDPVSKTIRTEYLYDVWVADYGFGITFWSTTIPSTTTTASNIGTGTTLIPAGGIQNLTQSKTASGQAYLPNSLLNAARNNIIGYWDVEDFSTAQGHARTGASEWKQYYGLYTIPAGQEITEFAFESTTANATRGNLLDGITFKTPSFLTVQKYAKLDGKEIQFVKPDDVVTMEMHVKNLGETTARGIVLQDSLYPFNAYIEYVGGIRVARKDGTAIGGCTYILPSIGNKQTLTVTLPAATTLATDEELVISFDVKVRDSVFDPVTNESTNALNLLYYFKNQAQVSYREAEFTAYTHAFTSTFADRQKKNGSGPNPIQVFIDPIKLSKTLTQNGQPLNEGERITGPFEVTLSVENALEASNNDIRAEGFITDEIPAGFTVTNLPVGATTENHDGVTRITIPNVTLMEGILFRDFTYTLEFVPQYPNKDFANGYGVIYTSIYSAFRYVYENMDPTSSQKGPINVMLPFPRRVVALQANAPAWEFAYDGPTFAEEDPPQLPPQYFSVKSDERLGQRFSDDGYVLTTKYELMIPDGAGAFKPAEKDNNGDFYIKTGECSVTLLPTLDLLFTPHWTERTLLYPEGEPVLDEDGNEIKYDDFAGDHTLYYRIVVTASKQGSSTYDLTSEVKTVTITVNNPNPIPQPPEEDDTSDPASGTSLPSDDQTGAVEQAGVLLNPAGLFLLAGMPVRLVGHRERLKAKKGGRYAKKS